MGPPLSFPKALALSHAVPQIDRNAISTALSNPGRDVGIPRLSIGDEQSRLPPLVGPHVHHTPSEGP